MSSFTALAEKPGNIPLWLSGRAINFGKPPYDQTFSLFGFEGNSSGENRGAFSEDRWGDSDVYGSELTGRVRRCSPDDIHSEGTYC
jgi:hypothetical protein